jgi:hypothetical protein
MDVHTFDRWSQLYAARHTRRAITVAMLAMLGVPVLQDADARKKHKKKKKCTCRPGDCETKVCRNSSAACPSCPDGQTCQQNRCVESCTPTSCPTGQVCVDGSCQGGIGGGDICPHEANLCDSPPTSCQGGTCTCGTDGFCSDCVVFLSPDPVTDGARASVGLPEGSHLGDVSKCTPHPLGCMTPCGSCPNCSCVRTTQEKQIKAEGRHQVVDFMSIGGR